MRAGTKLALFGALTLASFAFGYSWRDLNRGDLPDSKAVGALFGQEAEEKVTPTQLFRREFGRIRGSFYEAVDVQDLKYAAMSGLLAALGDPHTQFMEPRAAREFNAETKGNNYAGIGARLSPDPLGARIASVFEGPARKAGMRKGDLIIAVDGQQVAGKVLDDIVWKIRGREGSSVRLQVVRQGRDRPLTLTIRRAVVLAPSAEGEFLPGTKIGYLSVTGFSERTAEEFDNSLMDLSAKDMDGLIIDLRSNPGGLLETAVEMLSRFAEAKTVVKMRGRDGREEVAITPAGLAVPHPYPIVILMNEDSASAAEIFAGVMRDYKLATLVGEHTYGKASVQNVFMLVDGSSAKITVARYYLPSGADLSRRNDEDGQYLSGGLAPDVSIELTIDSKTVLGEPANDNQLRKAIEVLKSKMR